MPASHVPRRAAACSARAQAVWQLWNRSAQRYLWLGHEAEPRPRLMCVLVAGWCLVVLGAMTQDRWLADLAVGSCSDVVLLSAVARVEFYGLAWVITAVAARRDGFGRILARHERFAASAPPDPGRGRARLSPGRPTVAEPFAELAGPVRLAGLRCGPPVDRDRSDDGETCWWRSSEEPRLLLFSLVRPTAEFWGSRGRGFESRRPDAAQRAHPIDGCALFRCPGD